VRTLMFVHGTGVREKSFEATRRTIQAELNSRVPALADLTLHGCYWGKQCGVSLPEMPKSIPDYEAAGNKPSEREQELARWITLSCDPYFEFREILRQEEPWSGRVPPCRALPATIKSIEPEGQFKELLDHHELMAAFRATTSEIAESGVLRAICEEIPSPPLTISNIVARMITVKLLMKAEVDNFVRVDGLVRDRIVQLLVDRLGRAGAVKDVFGKALEVTWSILSPGVRWATRSYREDLTNVSSPVAGDIVAYQSPRGRAFRRRIAQDIADAPTEAVVLLAHSLGGIACFDLLADKANSRVTHLITAGCQAPFFYEIDALVKLRRGKPLPAYFPRNWMNVYDTHDILSYRADNVFPNSSHVFIQDVEVDSKESFPASHSAYWTHPVFWDHLTNFVKRP